MRSLSILRSSHERPAGSTRALRTVCNPGGTPDGRGCAAIAMRRFPARTTSVELDFLPSFCRVPLPCMARPIPRCCCVRAGLSTGRTKPQQASPRRGQEELPRRPETAQLPPCRLRPCSVAQNVSWTSKERHGIEDSDGWGADMGMDGGTPLAVSGHRLPHVDQKHRLLPFVYITLPKEPPMRNNVPGNEVCVVQRLR